MPRFGLARSNTRDARPHDVLAPGPAGDARVVCGGCGWKRQDRSHPVSTQTVNYDHMTLTHMFNVVRSPQFRLVKDNPASYVPKPNPDNEHNRIANAEEWEQLKSTLAPHLIGFLTVTKDGEVRWCR